MANRTQAAVTANQRNLALKAILLGRRAELLPKIQGKIRGIRADGIRGGANHDEPLDTVESAEADIQEDIEFALAQMQTDTLNKINEALGRLEQGQYGYCSECSEEIAEKRLRALPFSVRCKDCEEAREAAQERERALARRKAGGLFLDL